MYAAHFPKDSLFFFSRKILIRRSRLARTWVFAWTKCPVSPRAWNSMESCPFGCARYVGGTQWLGFPRITIPYHTVVNPMRKNISWDITSTYPCNYPYPYNYPTTILIFSLISGTAPPSIHCHAYSAYWMLFDHAVGPCCSTISPRCISEHRSC